MTAPDLTTEIIGYRQWYVTKDLTLRAAHKREAIWTPGVNTASCSRVTEKDPEDWSIEYVDDPCNDCPGSDCECGFYALHAPSDFWYGRKDEAASFRAVLMNVWVGESDSLLSGVIVAWGKVEVHHSGFRAEYARVAALAVPERKRDAAVARGVAAEYGVPCVPLDELPRIAAEFGAPIPAEMRPEKSKPKPRNPSSLASFWMSSGALAPTSQQWTYTQASVPIWTPPPLFPNGPTKRGSNRQGPNAGNQRAPKHHGRGKKWGAW